MPCHPFKSGTLFGDPAKEPYHGPWEIRNFAAGPNDWIALPENEPDADPEDTLEMEGIEGLSSDSDDGDDRPDWAQWGEDAEQTEGEKALNAKNFPPANT